MKDDLISRQAAIDLAPELIVPNEYKYSMYNQAINNYCVEIMQLPSSQPTLYGYNIEHLELIARVLQKENLSPERIVEVLTDIGRIVAIVKDEFEETLRKAVEQCMIFSRQDAIDALGADNNVESKGGDTT